MISGPRLTLGDAQRLSARRQHQSKHNATRENGDNSSSTSSGSSGGGEATMRRRPRNKKQQAFSASSYPRMHPNRYVALDCEMVGVGPDGNRSALARVSLVDYQGEVLLDTFVKVYEKVTDYRTHVSGIKPGDLEAPNAMCPTKLCPLVYRLLQNKILIGHGLENDLKLLGVPVDLLMIRDTAWYPPFMRMQCATSGLLCPRKLRDLSKEYLGLDIQGQQHDSVTDARAALIWAIKEEKERQRLRRHHRFWNANLASLPYRLILVCWSKLKSLFKLVESEWERSVMQMQCQRLVEMPRIMATGRPMSPQRPYTTACMAILA